MARSNASGRPVSLFLELSNSGKEMIAFSDSAFETFSIEVRTKKGAAAQPTTLYRQIGESSAKTRKVRIKLAPGKAASVAVPLDRLFDLSTSGDYVVTIKASFRAMKALQSVTVDQLDFAVKGQPFPLLQVIPD
jgi:hypothetical protein